MDARAVAEERPFSVLRGEGEGLEGGRRVVMSCMEMKYEDPLAVHECKKRTK